MLLSFSVVVDGEGVGLRGGLLVELLEIQNMGLSVRDTTAGSRLTICTNNLMYKKYGLRWMMISLEKKSTKSNSPTMHPKTSSRTIM